jgi:hypothetical protein
VKISGEQHNLGTSTLRNFILELPKLLAESILPVISSHTHLVASNGGNNIAWSTRNTKAKYNFLLFNIKLYFFIFSYHPKAVISCSYTVITSEGTNKAADFICH